MSSSLLRSAGVICLLILSPFVSRAADVSPADNPRKLSFESDIVPLLRTYCWKCHGGEGRVADLDLRSLPLLLRGGKSGPAVVAGSAEQSRIYQKLHAGEMPPGNELKPTAEHIQLIREWLNAGAAANYQGEPLPPHIVSDSDRAWWAFQTPQRPAIPTVRRAELAATPIDAFLLQRLEAKDLAFSAAVDRRTWIRRASLDVLGLPPRPEDVDAFLDDPSPDAHERLTDRLLASPHYGERWGRHWLDAAGYVDTIGSDNDASIMEERERIWKYRDYVIRAFNADMPFDRFLLEQLAGDELVDWKHAANYDPASLDLLIATGFLRQAADVTYAPELNTADIRHQVLYDTVQIVSSNLLGLTVHCAQCHDHKFDPISHAEYYQLAAFFTSAYDPQQWKHSKERFLFDVPPSQQADIDQHNVEYDRQIKERQEKIAAARAPFSQQLFETKLAMLPESLRADTQAAVQAPADKRNDVQKYLAEKLGPLLKVSDGEIDQALDEPARKSTAEWNQQVQTLTAGKKSYGKLQSLWNLETPARTYLYRRGDYQTPGPEISPTIPVVLENPHDPFPLPPDIATKSAGRRTAFARWLTNPEHPLTSRVFVNRVWQQVFGRGLVSTPDNFGASGAQPTHPELLDWLATEFTAHGWSIKQMHRRLLSSSAYRQSSHSDAASPAATIDPENQRLWRMPLRRLESETVRDCMLAVSGALDDAHYGPPLPLKPQPDGRVEIDVAKLPAGSSPHRRSLYLFSRRNYQLTEMSVFDQPAVAHNCTRRTSTAVVSQSLALMNGAFAFDQAERFADQVRTVAGADSDARITAAYRAVFSRPPDADELAAARTFLKVQSERLAATMPPDQADAAVLVNLCQMLLNTNEFLYVP